MVGGIALPGNPFDGHTLVCALDQVRRLTGSVIDEVFVDRGYRGHGEEESTVYISGQRRGIKTQRLRRSLKRRQAIEPVIGHLKSDGLLGRNYLKGTEGDHMNVMLSCAGHNLRLILRQLRIFVCKYRKVLSAQSQERITWCAHGSSRTFCSTGQLQNCVPAPDSCW